MKIALVHDSFTQLGGAERVLEALHEMFPQAPVFTLVLDRKYREKYKKWDIRTSWLQIIYNFIPRLQYLLPFIPLAVSSLDFSGYDVVISSSSSWAKNIRFARPSLLSDEALAKLDGDGGVPKNCIHICYCHTPTRFLWTDHDYVNREVPKILRAIIRPVISWMKRWDFKGAQRVNYFIANSKEVQSRISQYYHRTSTVVNAFVDTDFWHPILANGAKNKGLRIKDCFLLGGRLQAHKNNELIIEIFNELGLPLRVFGTGRQEKYLRSIAKSNITFLGRITDEQLRDQYSGALAFIYPQVEDFGLMPLEAAACGTATIGLNRGGSRETIIPGVIGELFGTDDVVCPFMGLSESDKVDKSNYAEASSDRSADYKSQIKQLILSWNPEKYKADVLRAQAEKFSKVKFIDNIRSFLDNLHG